RAGGRSDGWAARGGGRSGRHRWRRWWVDGQFGRRRGQERARLQGAGALGGFAAQRGRLERRHLGRPGRGATAGCTRTDSPESERERGRGLKRARARTGPETSASEDGARTRAPEGCARRARAQLV